MSATDELRSLLDEKGVEWRNTVKFDETTWVKVDGWHGIKAEPWCESTLKLTVYDVTPVQAMKMMMGRGKCRYIPDEQGYRWCTDDGEWQDEEDSASEECWSASCDKCGYSMIVGDDGGWFRGYDELKEWEDEDGKEHRGFILEPIFNFCPNCGREVER